MSQEKKCNQAIKYKVITIVWNLTMFFFFSGPVNTLKGILDIVIYSLKKMLQLKHGTVHDLFYHRQEYFYAFQH